MVRDAVGDELTDGDTVPIAKDLRVTADAVAAAFGADTIHDGFFGVTPVVRQPNPGTANALNTTQVLNNLITSLRSLGLVQ